jgi:hypothetical protein
MPPTTSAAETSTVATPVMFALVVLLLAGWIGVHWARRFVRQERIATVWIALRAFVGFCCWLAIAGAMSRVVELAGNWPRWVIALMAAGAIEAVIGLSRFERQTLSPRFGRSLLALRILLVVLLAVMLLQPVLAFESISTDERFVAVLLDDSASMQLVDNEPTVTERMELARLYGIDVARRENELDAVDERLSQIAEVVATHVHELELLSTANRETVRAHFQGRIVLLRDDVVRARDACLGLYAEIEEIIESDQGLDPADRQELSSCRNRLLQLAEQPLAVALRSVESGSVAIAAQNVAVLRSRLRQVRDVLFDVNRRITPIRRRLNESAYAALSETGKRRIDDLAQRTRRAIAEKVLRGETEAGVGLLDHLDERYTLRFYRFANTPRPLSANSWQDIDEETDESEEAINDDEDAWRQSTDFSAALRQIATDIPADQLSGVIVVTDGRDHSGVSLAGMARKLNAGGGPIHSVLVGSRQPPRDAAIAKLRHPSTIFEGDKLSLKANVKLDGFAKQTVHVQLFRNDELIDEKPLTPQTDRHREVITFAHEPQEVGVHDYRVQFEPIDGDSLEENNSARAYVVVTDERVKMLIIDSRPRWEFRYLRNLFAGRDRTVKLQALLLQPNRITGVPDPQPLPASAARVFDDFDATALPENEAEWLKFDVIVLGDVSPTDLTDEGVAALEKFVKQRGGTLVVIAGAYHMPHAFRDNRFAELLPIVYSESEKSIAGRQPAFRLELTPVGRGHMVMRQAEDEVDSAAVWRSLPNLYWRYPIVTTKPGATVLAYARPANEDGDDIDFAAEVDRQRRDALIATHSVGSGKVLMLNFDRTWRLRYRVGDKNHHRFWGQVLRWAAADKLTAGTEFVRLGTDRSEYSHGESVTVRARLVDKEDNPVESDEVAAEFYRGEQLVLRKQLEFDEETGRYEAKVEGLDEGGKYRVELVGPPVDRLLALSNPPPPAVSTEIAVKVKTHSQELVEVAADDSVLRQLADQTAGRVVGPADAAQLLASLGRNSKTDVQRWSLALWDSWVVLALFILAVCGEWLLRKKAGLT